MRRLQALALATAALIALPLAAQPVPAPDAGGTTPPVPLLWQVSDADNSLYLLGSFHLLKSTDYPVSADVEAAFSDAERLVFEVAPAELTDPSTGMKMLTASGFEDGRTLSEVLDAKQLAGLDALLEPTGQSAAMLEAFEPWFVNLSIVIGMSQRLGFSGEEGLDQYLIRRSAEAGKPASGLETIDEQLASLDNMPMDEQVSALVELIDDPKGLKTDLLRMHDAWRAGDVDAMHALAVDEMRAKTPESYRLVNVARNDAWVPQLRAMLDAPGEDDVLVVVGAMHLLGEDGVVEKLRAEGLDVVRVCSACEAP
ncbi:TraB/GumN family protein [Lysobacter sp. SG-8]|uniref:TraB/GumN family protein n=1 Tax=Marilutibacter penaei TaxID=2759900 RepID=A0A7W3U1Z7_9GAMM|nr:TraB/GumN family protein [Lysobacter penaei]MBB1087442.1 TraB/GumN family protein [Lysobacter penaei]